MLRLTSGTVVEEYARAVEIAREVRTVIRRPGGLARKMWRAPTEEPGGVLWETGTGRRRNFGVKRCGWR